MALGSMLLEHKFLNLSSSTGILFDNCLLQFNILYRQIELHFDLILPGIKSDKYKIYLPLRYITPDSFTINRFSPSNTTHSIIFETTVAPSVWKRSEDVDDEDLRDRLFWSENERWIRQCEIVPDLADPELAKKDTRIIMKHLLLPTGISSEGNTADDQDVGKLIILYWAHALPRTRSKLRSSWMSSRGSTSGSWITRL